MNIVRYRSGCRLNRIVMLATACIFSLIVVQSAFSGNEKKLGSVPRIAELRIGDRAAVPGVDYVEGEAMVKFRKDVTDQQKELVHLEVGAEVVLTIKVLQIQKVCSIWGEPTEILINRYRQNPFVEYAEPNYIHTPSGTISNDEFFDQQWGLHNIDAAILDQDIDAPEAWDIRSDSSDIVVAVGDTGVDYNHPDLMNRMWTNVGEIPGNGIDDDLNGYIDDIRGWDFGYDNGVPDNDPMDGSGHGTSVAGIVGAQGDNEIGITGVSWHTRIMPLRLGSVPAGIVYAADNGARVMNISYHLIATQALTAAFEYANSKGMFIVLPIINVNLDQSPYQTFYACSSTLPNVICVTSVGKDGERVSGYGATTVDLAAPGGTNLVQLYSTTLGGGYGPFAGPSAAAPHVAGAIAMILSQKLGITIQEVRDILIGTVDPHPSLSGSTPTVSGGRLNLRAALASPIGDTQNPTTPGNLQAVPASATEMNLTWNAATDNVLVDKYRIERCQGADCSNFQQIQEVPNPAPGTPSFQDTGLTANTTYLYRVRAIDVATHLGDYSNQASATTPSSGSDTTPPTNPSGLTATAQSGSRVTLVWVASTDNVAVHHYEVWRSTGGAAYTKLQPDALTNSYVDGQVSLNTTYVYKIRAVDGTSNQSAAYSNAEKATTVVLTDGTIVQGSTPVKAVHITQLRSAVNLVRAVAGLGNATWTDSLMVGVTSVRAVHIQELRDNLNLALDQLTIQRPSYTDPTLTPGVTIKKTHIDELRNAVR